MALSSNLVDPVVRIGSDPTTEPVATGFFYSFYIPEETAVWLVTCKHVIEEYQSLKMMHLPVYMNTVGGGVSTCPVPYTLIRDIVDATSISGCRRRHGSR